MTIQFVTYASLIIAFAAMLIKAFKYFTAPAHFRWELYPVPHEKGRADYGGSFFEELDWWNKPRQTDRLNELKEMMQEVFFLKGVYHNNKKVWIFSFPFHLGLYLCIGWLLLLLSGGILELVGIDITAQVNTIGKIVHLLTVLTGYAGLVLTGIGAFGLLLWRLSNGGQRVYNSPIDYINLILFDVVIAVTLIAHLTADPGFVFLRGYMKSLITFSPISVPGSLFTAEIVLVSLLIMYIPLTRMSHFVAKYFLYHAVRWNDEPNMRGSKIEKSIASLLNQKTTWSASHIQTGKPWSEVVKGDNDEQ